MAEPVSLSRISDDRNDATIVLDDDKPPTVREFEGATLQIGTGDSDVERGLPDVRISQPNSLSRDRPGSVMGRTSVKSTSSRTSIRPGVVRSDASSETFYSYKVTHFEKSVKEIRSIIKPELDGDFKGCWLLTEIDHWDFEHEKLVVLTDNSVFVVKYNFINETLYEYRRIMLHIIHSLHIGDFTYPSYSVMPNRKHGGIQISFNRADQLTFGQRWNPWCTDIPWVILSHHPLLYNPKENETTTYNVDDFFENLVAAASKVFTDKRPGETLKVLEGPIVIQSYASLPAVIYNRNEFGFFRDRSWLSF